MKVDRLLRVLHRLGRKAKEEERVIPDAGLRAFLQDAAHRLALRALDHVLDHALRGRLQAKEQHPAAAARHALQEFLRKRPLEPGTAAPMDRRTPFRQLRRKHAQRARRDGFVGEEDVAHAIFFLQGRDLFEHLLDRQRIESLARAIAHVAETALAVIAAVRRDERQHQLGREVAVERQAIEIGQYAQSGPLRARPAG